MACCVQKSCCGCLDLRISSLILGHILLVIKAIWLFLCSRVLYFYISFFTKNNIMDRALSDLRVALILSLIDELTLALEFIFIFIIIVGLFKKHREYLRPCNVFLAILFVVELASFIFWPAYYGFHIASTFSYVGMIIFVCNIITKLITFNFLFVVRSYYLKRDDTSSSGVVSNSRPKQSKLGIYYVP